MVTRVFAIDPNGSDVEVDFKVNLPVDVFRAFAIFKGQKAVHSQASDLSNPFGQPDYVVPAGIAAGGVLSCRFDSFGALNLVDQELKIRIYLKQGEAEKEFKLLPIKMRNYQDIITQCRKDAWVNITAIAGGSDDAGS